jgi:hypothetical protein
VSCDLTILEKVKKRFVFRKWFKSYHFPEDVLKFKWGFFCDTQPYMSDYRHILYILDKITGYKIVVNLPAYFTYASWKHYAVYYENIIKSLESINEEIPPKKNDDAKDMSVFGLLNITDFLSNAKKMTIEEVNAMDLYWILTNYKMEVYKNINITEKLKPKK